MELVMLKEYRVCTCVAYLVTPAMFDNFAYPMTINLASIATASEMFEGITVLRLHGDPNPFAINESYERFLRDWHSVKR